MVFKDKDIKNYKGMSEALKGAAKQLDIIIEVASFK